VFTREQDDELVMGLVEKALEKPSSNREAYLREACGDNSELFERVWHYIEWEERMHGFLLDPLPAYTGACFRAWRDIDAAMRFLQFL